MDDEGTLFRFHPVFRNFLIHEAQQSLPGLYEAQNARAAQWHIENDDLSGAIDHAIVGDCVHLVVEHMARTAIYDVEHCNSARLMELVSRLPARSINQHIAVRLAYVLALTIGLRPSAKAEIHALERDISNQGADWARDYTYAIRCSYNVLHRDDCSSALHLATDFIDRAEETISFPLLAMRNNAAYSLVQEGRYEEADSQLQHCFDAAERGMAPPIIELYSCFATGFSFRRRGLLNEARRSFRLGIQRTREIVQGDSAWTALNNYMLAEVYLELGMTDQAAETLGDGRLVIDETFQIDSILAAFRTSIALKQMAGDRHGAERLIAELEAVGQERNWGRLIAFGAVQRLRMGLPLSIELDDILPRGDEVAALSNPRSNAARLCAQLLEARWLEAWNAKYLDRCFELARLGQQFSSTTNATGELLRFDMLYARSLFQKGNQADGLERLANALERCARHGFLMMCIETIPETSWRLLDRTPSDEGLSEISRQFLDRVIAAAQKMSSPARALAGSDGSIFDLLTPREIDILIGVAHDASNKAIARQLHLTPETVKWHLKNMFKKLGVNSRRESLEKASELGLTLGNW